MLFELHAKIESKVRWRFIFLLLCLGHTRHKRLHFDGSVSPFTGLKDKDVRQHIEPNQGFMAYSDSSWHKTDELGFNSFGYVVYMFGGPVSCASKQLKIVALSSAEAEYYGMVKGASVGLGMQSVLKDFEIEVKLALKSDASAAIAIASRRGLGKVRHIEVCQLRLQAKVRSGVVNVVKVGTDENIADLLTKVHDISPKNITEGSAWQEGLEWMKLLFSEMPNVTKYEDISVSEEDKKEISKECLLR